MRKELADQLGGVELPHSRQTRSAPAGPQMDHVRVLHHGADGALRVGMKFILHMGFEQGSRTGHAAGQGSLRP